MQPLRQIKQHGLTLFLRSELAQTCIARHLRRAPFSVGEVGRVGTGRREIGHGKLAWRAVNSILPQKEEFPYTFRIVSEITHRFDAINVNKDGRIFVAWVDKRDLEKAKLQKKEREYKGAALYYVVSENFGESFKVEKKIVDSSCECCRISLTNDSRGNIIALWRQLYDGGIRDHAVAKIDLNDNIVVNRATFMCCARL